MPIHEMEPGDFCNAGHVGFDRNDSGDIAEKIEVEISPFGAIEFDECGRVRDQAKHADFLKWIDEQLAKVPVGYSGFQVVNSGRILQFDSLGHLNKWSWDQDRNRPLSAVHVHPPTRPEPWDRTPTPEYVYDPHGQSQKSTVPVSPVLDD